MRFNNKSKSEIEVKLHEWPLSMLKLLQLQALLEKFPTGVGLS